MNSTPDDRPEPVRHDRLPATPRVSRERYLVRRVGVLAVVAVVVVAVVRGVGALTGGDGETVDGETVVGDAASASSSPVASSGPDVTTVTSDRRQPSGTGDGRDQSATTPSAASASVARPPTTIAATTTSTAPAGPPTATDPADVLVVGDSDAGTFGPYLKVLLDDTEVASTEVDYMVSSGLARPDFYDWPTYLGEILPEADPDIVVVTFGGNDAQAMSLPDGTFPLEWNDPVSDAAEWGAEYQRRAGEVMDLLSDRDRTVIWVGIPNDDNPEVTERMAVQDQAAKAAAAERPDVVFVDAWARFSGRNGGWAEYVVDPRDGVGKDVRAEDGFHLNENGAEILALDIANVVRSDLVARGAAL